MGKYLLKRVTAAALGVAVAGITALAPLPAGTVDFSSNDALTAYAAETLDFSDFPQDYKSAADWIWTNRIEREQSTARRNTIFDQIIAGKGTINYVVKWQSYKTVTLEQRQKFETLVSNSINAWNDWLAGYENWPYEHIDVNIVGWAVIDANSILDPQPDEIIYTTCNPYDNSGDAANGHTVPALEPYAPSELSRFDHFTNTSYEYPGGLDKRFDMYLWATEGWPSIGGCGGDWGQRLSDDAYINMLDGFGVHVFEHEIGHGFGMTDFYGGEGEIDGFPPGGFPGGENSLMMAGSAAKITDFDGWMLRYMWTQIKDEEGRFDLTDIPETAVSESFTDTITGIGNGYVTFAEHGTYTYDNTHYGGNEAKNLAHYEIGDKISISLTKQGYKIVTVNNLTLFENAHQNERIMGDVNADGFFSISDAVMLQKWLFGTGPLTDWKAGDFCQDEIIDIFDLCLMKKALISKIDDPPQPSDELIDAPIKALNPATPTTGNVKMLAVYVDFPDAKYSSSAYTNEQLENELFGTGAEAVPYESLTGWFERASYGNLHLDGDVARYTCSQNMSAYQNDYGFENMAMEVLKGLDSSIDYSDYDSDNDGFIDCITFTVPLDNADDATKQFWYGCTATWYQNDGFTVDNMKLNKYIIMDVMPYKNDMKYLKQTMIHEMGHSMGLPDYYKYGASDWEGLHGEAGYTRMDDSLGDFCSFDKIMFGWLTDSQIQKYSGSGSQTFELSDASKSGSCLILPITSASDNYTSEYFLIEYITNSENNSDYGGNSGIRIFHIQSEFVTDYWGTSSFKYNNYSEHYMGDDKIRVIRLVNDGNGFYDSGDSISYGTSGFAAYDSNGDQTVNTGYTVNIGSLTNGKYSITISK